MSEPVGNARRESQLPNIPGNTHKDRTEPPASDTPEDKEKLTKVVEGKVMSRKSPWYKRAVRSMVADDAQNVGDYLVTDLVIPAFKNLLRDVVVGSVDRTLFGAGRNGRGVNLTGRRDQGIRTRYDKMAEEPRSFGLSREARARHDFNEIVLDSRAEAIEVVQALEERVIRYGAASVTDLYDLVGVSGSYADQRWGWADLRTADVRQSRGGWLIDLPQPEPLR